MLESHLPKAAANLKGREGLCQPQVPDDVIRLAVLHAVLCSADSQVTHLHTTIHVSISSARNFELNHIDNGRNRELRESSLNNPKFDHCRLISARGAIRRWNRNWEDEREGKRTGEEERNRFLNIESPKKGGESGEADQSVGSRDEQGDSTMPT